MVDINKIFDMTNHVKALKYILELNSNVYIYTKLDNTLQKINYIFSFDLPEIKHEIPYFKNYILSKLASINMHFTDVILTEHRLILILEKEELYKFVAYVNKLTTRQDNNIILGK